MSLIQILSIVGSVIFLTMILTAVYKEKIQEAYALIWIIAGIFILVISCSTKLLSSLSALVGIQTPGFAILLLLVFGMLLLLFQLTVVISKMQWRLRRLAEEFVLLKEEIQNRKK